MILKIFQSVGDIMPMPVAYKALISIYSGNKYPKKKAAGSLGGAVNGGTLIIWQDSNGITWYKRIK